MKTLEEIIKRDDYKRLTSQMRERVEELAEKIRFKMNYLDLKELAVKNTHLYVVSGRTKCGYYEYLALNENDVYYCIDGAYSGYIHGDFFHYCRTATNDMCLKFLNVSKEIFNYLDGVENEKVKDIEDALMRAK